MLTGGLLRVAGFGWWWFERGTGAGPLWAGSGQLPGDIRIERQNFRVVYPLTTGLPASIAHSGLFWRVPRFGR